MTHASHAETSPNGYYHAISANYHNYVGAINPTEARELFAVSLFLAKHVDEIATIRIRPAASSEIRAFETPTVVLGPTLVYSIPQRYDSATAYSVLPDADEWSANQKLIERLHRAQELQCELSCDMAERPRQRESQGMGL